MRRCWKRNCFPAQCLITRGQPIVTTWPERQTDCVGLTPRNALILLRSSFSAPKVLHLLRCSRSVSHQSLLVFDSVLRSTIQWLPMLTFPTLNGFRPASQWRTEAWWWDLCLRSHFLPFWLQRRAHSASRRLPIWLCLLQPRHASGLLVRMVVTTRCSAGQPSAETTILGSPRVLADKEVVKSSLSSPSQSASF